MKVLLLNHTFDPSDGQGKVNARLAERLLGTGNQVTLVGRDFPDLLANHPEAATVSLEPTRPAPTRLLKHLTFGRKSAKLIRQRRDEHDLVVANGGMTFETVDLNLCHFVQSAWIKNHQHPIHASFARRPFWATYQYAYTRQGAFWEANAYRRSRRVAAVSELIRNQLVEEAGVTPEKITVIENGLDEQALGAGDRQAARSEFGAGEGDFVLFFAAELRTPRKNFDVLLKALKVLPERVVLVAAGMHDGGPYPALASEMGLADRVRFLGFRRDVRDLYAGADAFALLSHYEPFGLVVNEAMAAGVPVVTAETVGAFALVRENQAGLVLKDPNDVEGVVRAVRSFLELPETRRQFSENARRASRELTWERVGDRYLELMTETLQEKVAEASRGGPHS